MTSHTTKRFREALATLPSHIRQAAENAYEKWKENPDRPGLHFKKIHSGKSIYSVRISLGYRAIGVKANDVMVWFWIGSHPEYEKMLSEL